MSFDKIKELQKQIKELHSSLDNVKNPKNIEKYNKLNEIQKRLVWIENDAINSLFDGKQNKTEEETITRLQGITNTLKFLIEAEKTMKENKLIKEAIKVEIRKMLKEEFTEIDELARIAKTLKIVDKDKAQQVIDKFKGGKKTWIADMIEKVIEAGDEGIAQVALAKAIGKVDEFGDGRQQAINPEVRSLLGAGIFTFGEAGVPVANASSEPEITSTETAEEEIDEPTTETSEDDEDVEIEDEYEKVDAEDQGEDEEELAKKATPNPKLQKKSSELDNVIKDLKKLAKEYTDAKKDGDKEKEKDLIAKLKEKNKEKDKLTKDLDKDLGAPDED